MNKFIFLIIVAVELNSLSLFAKDSVLLTDLHPVQIKMGWGNLAINKSINHNPLSINNTKYKNGFGTHAEGFLIFKIPQNATSFSAVVGLDDDSKIGKLKFFIQFSKEINNFKTVAESPEISNQNRIFEFKNIKIPKESNFLRIELDSCGKRNGDHGDICNGLFSLKPTPTTTPTPNKIPVAKKVPLTRKVKPLSIYCRSGKILTAEITSKKTIVSNIHNGDELLTNLNNALYAAVVIKPDSGRTLSPYDYVLVDNAGHKHNCIAIKEGADSSFNASKSYKTQSSKLYTLLFIIPKDTANPNNLSLHFNLPLPNSGDIKLEFNRVETFSNLKPSKSNN